MITFKEYDSVVYNDAEGNMIDTFAISDTDAFTGLTHINYMNLKVPVTSLKLHPKSMEVNHIPLSDMYSLELLRRLKAKFETGHTGKKVVPMALSKAS